MFNYEIVLEKEFETHTYLDVKFSNGQEDYYQTFIVWNENKEMEIETLKITQFLFVIENLEQLIEKYGRIYNDENKINII